MPDTDTDRWKMVTIVVVVIALTSIMLNIHFYLNDNSETTPCANDDQANNSNMSHASNVSGENETTMHKIAVVGVTPGGTTEIK